LAGVINWYSDFIGVAYRYYDLRMNVAPLFPDRKEAVALWHSAIKWWVDHTIKLRFVEVHDDTWFVMAAESPKSPTNTGLFKILPRTANYERFKKGHAGEAYIRLGIYQLKYKKDVKDDAVCDCGHTREDHDDDENDDCLYEDCDCKKFRSFQVTLLRNKKTITDIKFLAEHEIKDDPLVWNCPGVSKE